MALWLARVSRGITRLVLKLVFRLLLGEMVQPVYVCPRKGCGSHLFVKHAPFARYVIGNYMVAMIGAFCVWKG